MIRTSAVLFSFVAAFFQLGIAEANDINIAIKNGETLELTRLYWVNNCKSNLKSPPTAEILDGPENLAIAVKAAMVLPRVQGCSKEVSGGIMSMTAKDVDALSVSKVVVRVKYSTKDGDRFRSYTYKVTALP